MKLISAHYVYNEDYAVISAETIGGIMAGTNPEGWFIDRIELSDDDVIPARFTPVSHKMPKGAMGGILIIAEQSQTHEVRLHTTRMFFYEKDHKLYTLGIEVPIDPEMSCILDNARVLVIPNEEVCLYRLSR
jgi:hypothetical protein